MKHQILIIVVALATTLSTAQKTVTLDECIDIALNNNLTLKNSALNTGRQKLERNKAGWSHLPTIDAGVTQDFKYGFNIDPKTNSRTNDDVNKNDLFLRADLDVLNISKFKSFQRARVDLKKQEEDFKSDTNQLIIDVVEYYTKVLYRKELVEIVKQQSKESDAQLLRLKDALKYGYIAKSELYDAQAEAAQDQRTLAIAKNDKDKTILNLLNLINYDEGKTLIEYEDYFKVDTTSVNGLNTDLKNWVYNNPQSLSAKYEVESNRKAVEINRAKNYPVVSLRYELESFFEQEEASPNAKLIREFENQIRDNQEQSVRVALDIPVFNGMQNRYDVQLAKLDVEAAKIKEELVNDNLKFEIETTINDIENAVSTYKTSLQVLKAGLESFRTSKLKYEQGKINAFNFAIAKKNLLRAEVELVEVKYNLFFSRKKLEILSSGLSKLN